MLMGEVRAEQLMRSIAPAVREGLTQEQEAAIRTAIRRGDWDMHPVDMRLTIPTPFGRYYATFIAGPERRNPTRRAADRRRRPLVTMGNIVFFASATVFAGFCAIGLLSMAAGILAY